jgi:hypothetical protein
MKVPFALLGFFTLLSQGWAMDDHQMSELMVGTWQAVGQEQMYNGIARYVVSCTYTEDGRFDATWSWVFPPTPGQATSGVVRDIGTWKIQNGALSCHVEQVDPPSLASLYQDSSSRIVFIDRNTWKFENGAVGVAHRQ